jgi:ParB/RepB/Spo0J family partition protein
MIKKKKSGFASSLQRTRSEKKSRPGEREGAKYSEGLILLGTREVRIKDLIIRERFRTPTEEDAASLAESLKANGQARSITVHKANQSGKHRVIAGATLVRAAEILGWTKLRADIVKCSKAQARRWEVSENLYRHHLSALEEAQHMDEWVRITVEEEDGSHHSKRGRPEGAISKAARKLPLKGKTQAARQKRIERALKIASLSPEAEAAAKEKGLENNRTALTEMAKEESPAAQVKKAQELGRSKAKALSRRPKKTRKGSLRLPSEASLSSTDKKQLRALVKAWGKASKLKDLYAEASSAVRDEFLKLLQSLSDGDADLESASVHQNEEHEADGESTVSDEDNDDDDDDDDDVGDDDEADDQDDDAKKDAW